MRTSAGGGWLAVGLLLGCSPDPSEVIGPYGGTGGSSGSATGGPSSGEPGTAGTGPIADGSAESGGMPTSATGDTGTTAPVDPMTTDPDTSTSGGPPSESSGGEPGSSSGPPDPPPSCMDLFGGASGYTFCDEDETSCTFAVNANGVSCEAICTGLGHACVGAIDNPEGLSCSSQGPLDCDDIEGGSTICICAK